MVNLVMFVAITDLAKTFAASILTFKWLLRNVGSHMVVQFVKIVENDIAFLELAVIEPVILSADPNSTLFKLVNQKFLIGRNESLESSNIWIKIAAVQDMYLHLIGDPVSIFENK